MPKPPLPAELSEFLARPNPAVIGTVTASGDPRTVATWYVWDGGRVLMNLEEAARGSTTCAATRGRR